MFEISESLIPWQYLHPIFVNFSAALVPASAGSDFLGRLTKKESLTQAAWWMLLYATIATPLTVVAGWFWKFKLPAAAMPEDVIFTHQWLGTSLVFLFLALAIWRGKLFIRNEAPGIAYFVTIGLTVIVLGYQGHIGGTMVFG